MYCSHTMGTKIKVFHLQEKMSQTTCQKLDISQVDPKDMVNKFVSTTSIFVAYNMWFQSGSLFLFMCFTHKVKNPRFKTWRLDHLIKQSTKCKSITSSRTWRSWTSTRLHQKRKLAWTFPFTGQSPCQWLD